MHATTRNKIEIDSKLDNEAFSFSFMVYLCILNSLRLCLFKCWCVFCLEKYETESFQWYDEILFQNLKAQKLFARSKHYLRKALNKPT